MNWALLLVAASAQAQPPLHLWHAYRGTEEQALIESVKRYTQATGQPVELLPVPYDAFSAKLSNAIPHGNGPDVFIFNHERLRLFHDEGLIAPVDARFNRADYVASSVEALSLDSAVYGYPLALKCLALYVNRALFRGVGSWPEDLQQNSHPEQGVFGLAYESGDFYYHAAFLFGFGGKLFDATGRAQFDTPQMAASLAFVKGLQDARSIPAEASGALVKTLFNSNRAAMVIGGPWFAGEISPDIDYSVVPLPTLPRTGLPMRPFLGVEAALVSAHSEHPQDAQALALFLSTGAAARVRATLGRQVPAELAAYQDPAVRDDKLLQAFRQGAEQAVPMPNSLEMARVWEPMKLALKGTLQGGVSPEQAGGLADRRYRALYRPRPPDAPPVPYIVAGALLALGAGVWQWRKRRPAGPWRKRFPDWKRGLAYVSPAAAGVGVLVVIPLGFGAGMSLFHHEPGRFAFVGLANFWDLLASPGYRITEPLSIYFTLAVTIVWAVLNVSLHVSIGLGLALLLKNPLLRLRGVFRVLLIVPWAVPNYITASLWKQLFHQQFGAINAVLGWFGVQPLAWWAHFSTAFAANVATNTWLGFPFMMVVALGALQSIPPELYEAADVDGASAWVKFRRITLPLLKPALLPAVILGGIWSFNMFNIIYLVSGGEPGGATDILVTDAYRWAFERNEQYGFAAAYSVLIFAVLVVYSTFTRRLARGAEELTA